MRKSVIIFILLATGIIFFIPQVFGANVTSCGTLNSANTIYDLQNNLSSASNCITITGSNITFDGHGYTLLGNLTNQGIYVSSGNQNIIKNTNFNQLNYGVYIPAGLYHQVLNNTFNGSVSYGLYIPGANNTIIANNTFTSSTDSAIYIPTTSNMTLHSNIITSSGDDGVYDPISSANIYINNTITFSTGSGVDASNAPSFTFINNTFSNNTLNGLYILNGPNSIIMNNIFNSNNASGINITSSSNITIQNNTLQYNTRNGLYAYSVNASLITNNTANNNSYMGLELNHTFNGTISYNTASINSYNGIGISRSYSNNLSRNTIYSNIGYGINSVASSYNNIEYNDINASGYDNIDLHSTNYTTVSYNNASYSGYEGIDLQGNAKSNTIIGNTANYNNETGMYLTATLNNTINNNTFIGNPTGIVFSASNYSSLSSNTIINSSLNGIQMVYGSVGNNFTYLIITTPTQHAVIINGSSNNNQFIESNISRSSLSYYDLFLNIITGTLFSNTLPTGNYSFVNSSITIENTHGAIAFLSVLNGEGTNLSNDISFESNTVWFNASNTLFNMSANISLYNSPAAGKSNPYIGRNGERCNECNNLSVITADNITFNVTQGGTYSILGNSTSSSSGGNNGGGGSHSGPTEITYTINEEQLTKGYSQTLNKKDQLKFITGSANSEEHHVTIDQINYDTNEVTITISSTPKTYTLKSGISQNYDLDNDEINDIMLKFTTLTTSSVTLYITKSEETTNPSATKETTVEIPESKTIEETKTKKSPTKLIIIGIIIILLIIGLILIFRKKEPKTPKELSPY